MSGAPGLHIPFFVQLEEAGVVEQHVVLQPLVDRHPKTDKLGVAVHPHVGEPLARELVLPRWQVPGVGDGGVLVEPAVLEERVPVAEVVGAQDLAAAHDDLTDGTPFGEGVGSLDADGHIHHVPGVLDGVERGRGGGHHADVDAQITEVLHVVAEDADVVPVIVVCGQLALTRIDEGYGHGDHQEEQQHQHGHGPPPVASERGPEATSGPVSFRGPSLHPRAPGHYVLPLRRFSLSRMPPGVMISSSSTTTRSLGGPRFFDTLSRTAAKAARARSL